MRSVVFVILAVSLAAGATAQTFRSRAPLYERFVGERLRLAFPRSDARAMVFPCKPAGRGCAANPLAANQVVLEGPAEAWAGFELCRRTASGDTCVALERVFGER